MLTNRIFVAVTVALALPLASFARQVVPPPAPSPSPAAPAGSEPPPPPTEAEKQLDAALAKVKALKSVSAKLVQNVKMLGLKYDITGTYLRAPDYRIYLLLSVEGLGDVKGRLLQVCDGETFWEVREVLESRDIRKRQVRPILEKLSALEEGDELREMVIGTLGFAGPEALLAGLRKEIAFDQMEEGVLKDSGAPAQERKVWILRGRWKDRERLTPPNQPPLPATAPLPPYVPSIAEVWIDQETGWPHWVRLTGRAPSILETRQDLRELELGPDGRPVGPAATKVDRSEVVLRYSEVQLDTQLNPLQFYYSPPQGPNIPITDETGMITTGLSNAIADRAMRKRAEAAQQAPLELPRSIAVPPPDGAAQPAVPSPSGPPVSAPTPRP